MELEGAEDTVDSSQSGGPGEQDEDNVGAATGVTAAGEEEALPEQDGPKRARTFPYGEMLVEAGMLSEEGVAKAQQAAREEGLPLGRILVRDGLVMSRDLAAFTALHLGLTMVDLRSENLDPEVVSLLPQETANKYTVLALRRNDGYLTVAMADPTDLQAIQDLTARTGFTITPVVAEDQELIEHIEIAYKKVREPSGAVAAAEDAPAGGRLTADQLRSAQPAKFVDMLLAQAHHDGASDIHIEPAETKLRIRFRIDGVLQETMSLPADMHPTLISRIKILSSLNIAERRRPQDGQLSFEPVDGDRKIDVRTAICNTIHEPVPKAMLRPA